MEHYSYWSLIPPLLAIFLAIRTKQVYISLLLGIFAGYLIIVGGNPFLAFMNTVQGLVDVFKDSGNTRTIMFCALVGGLILLIQRSGGVEGFVRYVQHKLDQQKNTSTKTQKIQVQMLAYILGLIIFVETSISALTVGTLFRTVFDRLGISRDKLAFLADTSSAPSSILIPFNAWGAFIMGLLAANGFDKPFSLMIQSLPYNLYPFITIVIVLIVIRKSWNIGPMKQSEANISLNQSSTTTTSIAEEDPITIEMKPGIQPKASNMIIPLATMILMMPVMLMATGWNEASQSESSGLDFIFKAIGAGSGSTSVLIAVLTALMISGILYRTQKIFAFKEWFGWVLKGTSALLPLALLMMLAFSISQICKDLGTGLFVADVSSGWLQGAWVPALVFLISCFIAFSTGTSWGTFAIMMAISLPLAQQIGVPVPMVIAAVLSGGVFGDHCSPISDTTIISSLASGTDHISHVRTQLPYALLAGGIAFLGFVLMGFLLV